jgi:hypothetical protein
MSRRLTKDLSHLTLDQINKEIAELEALPRGQRTLSTTERLADLYEAKSRICGHRYGRFCVG